MSDDLMKSRPSDKEGGGGHPDPEIRRGGRSQFDLKRWGPPGPLPWIYHWNSLTLAILINSGYSLKVSSDSGSWEKKVKQRQRNKTQLSYHDKWRDGVPLLTQRGWKSLILQGSTDSGIQNLRSFPDFFPKQSFLYPDSKLSNTPWFLKGRLALIQD